ncbi:MAG TPA: hypothetical protein VFU43_08710 [Streptosporangiaceae bacterium]|nr:hypothetical protein [Streptosporangiaceae bacterium]
MRRLFWLTLGAVLGAWSVLRVQRLARQFGPRGVAGRAVGAGAALRAFAADVRIQMHQREVELRRAAGGTLLGGPSAPPARPRRAIDPSDRYNGHDTDKDGH